MDLMFSLVICYMTLHGRGGHESVPSPPRTLAGHTNLKMVLCAGSSLQRCTSSSAVRFRRSLSASSLPKLQMGYAALAITDYASPLVVLKMILSLRC